MSTVQLARGARGAAHVIGAAAINYAVLSLPEPARSLAGYGLPTWAAYAALVTERFSGAIRALSRR